MCLSLNTTLSQRYHNVGQSFNVQMTGSFITLLSKIPWGSPLLRGLSLIFIYDVLHGIAH